jgi:hypothetical protein
MATIFRHGGEAHVMRPDGVMRSSIIRPFVGYNPQADVQAVAQAFTTGGPLATQLAGLGAPGPIATWWANVKARFAMRKVEKAVEKAAIIAASSSPGPETVTASQVAPQMQAQMQMLRHLTQHSNALQVRGPIAQAGRALASRRYFTYYRAG